MRLQEYVGKYLGQVYITDMVQTEGPSGADFESEWRAEPEHKQRLISVLQKIGPQKIGALGRVVERLLKQEFPDYEVIYIVHPAATRYPKNLAKWDEQFKHLAI